MSKEYRTHGTVRTALSNVSLSLDRGRTLGVVGESGSGKTTLARLIAGLDAPTAGSVLIDGQPPRLRRRAPSPVQMVFQQPTDALNPFLSIGASVAEPLRSLLPHNERSTRVEQLLASVGLDPRRSRERPRSFSGGQLQRVVIARALAGAPRVLICDEPTSALDVSVQAQIINLLLDLQSSLYFACLFITHDLSIARILSDDVLVLKGGTMMEYCAAGDFFEHSRDVYSRTLLDISRKTSLDHLRTRQPLSAD